MSLMQVTFLFDYRAFQSAALPLVIALDAGDPDPLQLRVAQIRQEVGPIENWILHDRGGYIWDPVAADDPRYQSGLWGHWFLIVLSTFLSPDVSLENDWTKLVCTLHSFGWDDEDVHLVVSGLPTVCLLNPEAPYQQGMHIQWSDPYWYWISPSRSTHVGWLPFEEVARLRQRLLTDQHLLNDDFRTRVRLPPSVSAAKAHISRELDPDYWYERIPFVYHRAIEMMSQAFEAGKGLFSVVYQAYGDPDEWDEEETDDQV